MQHMHTRLKDSAHQSIQWLTGGHPSGSRSFRNMPSAPLFFINIQLPPSEKIRTEPAPKPVEVKPFVFHTGERAHNFAEFYFFMQTLDIDCILDHASNSHIPPWLRDIAKAERAKKTYGCEEAADRLDDAAKRFESFANHSSKLRDWAKGEVGENSYKEFLRGRLLGMLDPCLTNDDRRKIAPLHVFGVNGFGVIQDRLPSDGNGMQIIH